MSTPISETMNFQDALRGGTRHTLEFFRQGGEVFLKVELAPPTGNDQAYCQDGTPYTASIAASLGPLTLQQLQRIEQAVADAKRHVLP